MDENAKKAADYPGASQRAAEQLTMSKAVAPVADDDATVRYKKKSSSSVHVIGATDQYAITSGVGLSEGRFMTPGESSGGRPVCILGSEVAANLFPRLSP